MRSRISRLLTAPVREPRRAPRARLMAEALEAREVPARVNFTFALDESAGSFGLTTTQRNLFLTDLQAAGQLWSDQIAGAAANPVTLEVRVVPAALGSSTYANCGPTAQVVSGGVSEAGTLYESRAGVDPNGAVSDITMTFNTAYLQSSASFPVGAFFDPSGAARTGTVPAGQADVISVALHEMGHGLGIVSARNSSGVVPPGIAPTTFDTKISGAAFVGAQAQVVNGGAVALSADYSHLNVSGDLMFPSIGAATRRSIGGLDTAVLRDLGWAPVITATAATASATFSLDSAGNLFRQAGGTTTLVALAITDMEVVQGQLFVRNGGNNVFRYNAAGGFDFIAASVLQIGQGLNQFFVLNGGNNVFRYNWSTGGFDLLASAVLEIGQGQGQFFVRNGGNNVFRYNAAGGFDLLASAVVKIGSSQGDFLVLNGGNNVYRYNGSTGGFDLIASSVLEMESSQGQVFVRNSGNAVYRYSGGGFALSTVNIIDIWSSGGLFYVKRSDGAIFRYSPGLGDYILSA